MNDIFVLLQLTINNFIEFDLIMSFEEKKYAKRQKFHVLCMYFNIYNTFIGSIPPIGSGPKIYISKIKYIFGIYFRLDW